MGTFSSHPFGNDTALDLCDLFSELDDQEKSRHLTSIFENALNPKPGEYVWTDEVIAAAALIALVLPGGGSVVSVEDAELDLDSDAEAEEEWYPALLHQPSNEVVALANRALRHVTGTATKWYANWLNDSVRSEAVGRIDRISAVLRTALP
ncbi:DUF4259 domain-containing protein [Actinoplanes sp. NPDC020271]|uniref:DUF4259 domain-containing protein n=1 Tax=Actinoplanes sp. NPDC020271 TaxID=3363896 RepID=UPI00378DC401